MIKFKTGWPLKKASNQSANNNNFALETARLFIRPPMLSDYEEWALVRDKNRDYLKPFEPQWPKNALSLSLYNRRLERQAKDVLNMRGAYFYLFDKQTNNIIGGINLNNIVLGAARHASIGYWLDEGEQGNGYMEEGAKAVIDYAFNALKLRRINAACLPDNAPSARLLEKLKFEEEGFAKSYLQIDGIWQDHRLFGLCVT